MANLSDEEFDALMDAMPQGARNQVLSQIREGEGPNVKLPEKHDLYKNKRRDIEQLGPITEDDLVEFRERMLELGYKSFAPINVSVDAEPPLSKRQYLGVPEPVSEPQEAPEPPERHTGKVMLMIVALVLLAVLDPVVSVVLVLAGVAATVGRKRHTN